MIRSQHNPSPKRTPVTPIGLQLVAPSFGSQTVFGRTKSVRTFQKPVRQSSRQDLLERYQLECESDYEYSSNSSDAVVASPTGKADSMELVISQLRKAHGTKLAQNLESSVVFHDICKREGIPIPPEFLESVPWPEEFGGQQYLMFDPVVTRSGLTMSRFMAPTILGANHGQLLNPKGRLLHQWIASTSRKYDLLSMSNLIDAHSSKRLKDNLVKLGKDVSAYKLMYACFLTVKNLSRRIIKRSSAGFWKLKVIERLKINRIRRIEMRQNLTPMLARALRSLRARAAARNDSPCWYSETEEVEEDSEYDEPEPQKPPTSRHASLTVKKKRYKKKRRHSQKSRLKVKMQAVITWSKVKAKQPSPEGQQVRERRRVMQKFQNALVASKAFQLAGVMCAKVAPLKKEKHKLQRGKLPLKSLGLVDIPVARTAQPVKKTTGSVFKRLHPPPAADRLPIVRPVTPLKIGPKSHAPKARAPPLVLFQNCEWKTLNNALASPVKHVHTPTPPPPQGLEGPKGRIMKLQKILEDRAVIMDSIQQADDDEVMELVMTGWNKDGGVGDVDSGDEDLWNAEPGSTEMSRRPLTHFDIFGRPDTGGRIREHLETFRNGIRNVINNAEELQNSWDAQDAEHERLARIAEAELEAQLRLGKPEACPNKAPPSCKISNERRIKLCKQLPYPPSAPVNPASFPTRNGIHKKKLASVQSINEINTCFPFMTNG
eukprot:TRINITY_DN8080_c0_g1_i1.p1 TRINITY_DN8080_c0_g1~~TRINITY_DN8080_c0_g1_i1.p1  ORF type:complete len:716 (+),score=121.51 TRINITY_DN8080_c0_g1_i1:277-2424(+)